MNKDLQKAITMANLLKAGLVDVDIKQKHLGIYHNAHKEGWDRFFGKPDKYSKQHKYQKPVTVKLSKLQNERMAEAEGHKDGMEAANKIARPDSDRMKVYRPSGQGPVGMRKGPIAQRAKERDLRRISKFKHNLAAEHLVNEMENYNLKGKIQSVDHEGLTVRGKEENRIHNIDLYTKDGGKTYISHHTGFGNNGHYAHVNRDHDSLEDGIRHSIGILHKHHNQSDDDKFTRVDIGQPIEKRNPGKVPGHLKKMVQHVKQYNKGSLTDDHHIMAFYHADSARHHGAKVNEVNDLLKPHGLSYNKLRSIAHEEEDLTEKAKRCVKKVHSKSKGVNPYAVCVSSIGKEGAFKDIDKDNPTWKKHPTEKNTYVLGGHKITYHGAGGEKQKNISGHEAPGPYIFG